jgi:SAM-dependent methyltransferase
MKGLPRYVFGWAEFRKNYKGKMTFHPCLYDWYEEGGSTKDEYFWQDLYVARKIYANTPVKHVDIGSRVDSFVAHVASFREIEVFDIRPITTSISGIVFKQADLMKPLEHIQSYCDSISCLHALEHFGLGRYGDPINPNGYELGIKNMAKILKKGGLFYLSIPIGKERVEFNANRVFNPKSIVQLAKKFGLEICELDWIVNGQSLAHSFNINSDLELLSQLQYTLGIFTFVKQN